jgi:hypothetical protein
MHNGGSHGSENAHASEASEKQQSLVPQASPRARPRLRGRPHRNPRVARHGGRPGALLHQVARASGCLCFPLATRQMTRGETNGVVQKNLWTRRLFVRSGKVRSFTYGLASRHDDARRQQQASLLRSTFGFRSKWLRCLRGTKNVRRLARAGL